MTSQPTRWGIASAGKISTDFCTAMRLLAGTENQIAAVAARKLEDAQAFAAKHGARKAYGSYKELAADPDVEIVYIGSIHTKHYELSCLFLEAGKHVLCEKPLGMSAEEVRKMTGLAQRKGLFFMEGFWSRFFPVYGKLREELASNSIGEVRFVTIAFGFPFNYDVQRLSVKELGGGITLDVGCYATQLATLIFNNEHPEKISSLADVISTGVDRTVCTTLCYSGGRMAQILASGECMLTNTAVIYGTKGTITIPMMWTPSEIHTPNGTFSWPIPEVAEPFNFKRSGGFVYQINAARKALIEGKTQIPEITHADSLLIAEIQDEILRQIGVTYK